MTQQAERRTATSVAGLTRTELQAAIEAHAHALNTHESNRMALARAFEAVRMTGRLLDREGWNALCADYAGPLRDGEITVTVRGTEVDLESHDGVVQASLHPHRDATDVRVGDVQVLVAKNRVAVVMRRGPYPIKEWEVLWEGDLSRATALTKEGRDA